MIQILRRELTRFTIKFVDIRVPENISQSKLHISLLGKDFRVTPLRFTQSKTNHEGKPETFKYTPGMSPAEFKNSGRGPKKPLYQRMAGERGKMGYTIGFVTCLGWALILPVSSYTWNSAKVLDYFERSETKLPRTLLAPLRFKGKKESYYVRFDLMLLIQSVLKDLNISETKQEDMDIYTADSLKVEGHGYTSTSFATMVGVPYFFEWDSVEQVNLEQIRHKWKYPIVTRFTNHSLTLENLELSSDELNELKETFVLSSNAKKFAIAQKLIEMERYGDWAFYTFIPSFAVLMLNQIACHTNDIFKMFESPSVVRYALYNVHTAIILSALYLIYGSHMDEVDRVVDAKLQILGRDYLEGGKEYYTKEMRRGQLLRKGLSKEGEEYFNENGGLKRLWYEPDLADTPNSLLTTRIKPYDQLLS